MVEVDKALFCQALVFSCRVCYTFGSMAKKILIFLGVGLYLVLIGLGFYLLHISQTGRSILSPWQTIHPAYIYVFAATTMFLGLLIIFYEPRTYTPPTIPPLTGEGANAMRSSPFVSLPRLGEGRGMGYMAFFSGKNFLILLLIIHSFLLRSYLPLTHQLLYGADGWRHIANEERILQGLPFLEPKLSGSLASTPQPTTHNLLTTIGRLSYSELWYSSAALADTFHVNLLTVNKWLIPILWSLFFPLLMFAVGKALKWDDRQSLFLVWLSSLPFALQSAGSFTLPVNLGFLIWLLLFLVLLKRADTENPRRGQIIFLLIGGIVTLFGYSLFCLLFWLSWGLVELVQYWHRHGRLSPVILIVVGIVSALFFSGVELGVKYSYVDLSVKWTHQVTQLIGNFSGWYLASGPRPHDIATGNIIFNQTPSYAFIANAFTMWRWWLVIFMILFWVVVIFGLREFWRRRTTPYSLLLTLSLGLTGSYIFSRYFLSGEQVLTRRLDIVLAFFFIILFTAGLMSLFKYVPSKYQKSAQVGIIIILTMAIAASYSLGPDTNTVSMDEYHVMQYVWSQEQNNSTHCVVADTYPLLALEAISHKEIIGGGFPINANFGQPELIKSYRELTANPSFETWRDILNAQKTNDCWLVALRNNLQYNAFMAKDLGNLRFFNDTVAWHYIGPSISIDNK